jgi:cytochrome c
MNGFELNKLIAAALLAILIAMLTGFIAEKAVHVDKLAKNVLVVEGVGKTLGSSPETAPKGPAPIAPLLAKADVEAGQKAGRVCGTCHSFNNGEPAKTGPNLYGIIGLHHDHMAGFEYSDAMEATKDKVWDFEELNAFLFNPRAHIPGTKMTFAGIKSDEDRANVIAWLRTLSSSPVPLPSTK